MYGTSRLIIPPKPARNSPYIPKLRIKLRPSGSRSRLSREVDRSDSYFTTRDTKQSARVTPVYMNGDTNSPSFISHPKYNTSRATSHSKFPGRRCLGKRASRRRKSGQSAENIDLDDSESVLTSIGLKTLVNRETFYLLPVETQRMLASLLPLYDQQPQAWLNCFQSPYVSPPGSSDGFPSLPQVDTAGAEDASPGDKFNGSTTVWLHQSSLSNEFFHKALQDYSVRQARGDFIASRVRHRAGLRPSVRSQSRYTSPSVRGAADQNNLTIKGVEDDGSTWRQSPKILHRKAGFSPCQTKSTTPANGVLSKETLPNNSSSLSRMHNRLSKRVRRPLRRTRCSRSNIAADPTASTLVEHDTRSSSAVSIVIGSPGSPADSRCHENNCGLSGRVSSVDSVNDLHAPSLKPSVVSAIPTTTTTNLNKFSEGDASLQLESIQEKQRPSGQKPCSDVKSLETAEFSKMCSPSTVASTNTSSVICRSSNSPRTTGVRQSRHSTIVANDNNDDLPPQMPPPRQTKTLASMREKLRAKRLLKESERVQTPNGRLHQSIIHSLPGSMTPHPASGGTGYFNAPVGYLSSPVKSVSGSLTSPVHGVGGGPTSLSLLLNGQDEVGCGMLRSSVYSGGSSSGQSSPHSLPTGGSGPMYQTLTDVSSPVPNTTTAVQISESNFDTFDSQALLLSCPSSPHSHDLSSGHTVSTPPITSASHRLSSPIFSPQTFGNIPSISASVNCATRRVLLCKEHSVSAPPTPLSPQVCHTLGFPEVNKSHGPLIRQSPVLPSTGHSPVAPVADSVSPLRILPVGGSTLVTQSEAPWSVPPVQLVDICDSGLHCNGSSGDIPYQQSINSPPAKRQTLRVSHSNPQLATVSQSSCFTALSPSLLSNNPDISPAQKLGRTENVSTLVSLSSDPTPITTSTVLSPDISLSKRLIVGTSIAPATVVSCPSESGNSSITQERSNTTTRAYFVDGDNLPEAVALIQNMNPRATITQHKFLLIPSPNKSQLYLCRAPVTQSSDSVPPPLLNLVSSTATKNDTVDSATTASKAVSIPACPSIPYYQPIEAASLLDLHSSTVTLGKINAGTIVSGPKVMPNTQTYNTTIVERLSNDIQKSTSNIMQATTEVSNLLVPLNSSKSIDFPMDVERATAPNIAPKSTRQPIPRLPFTEHMTISHKPSFATNDTTTSGPVTVEGVRTSPITISVIAPATSVSASIMQDANPSVRLNQSDTCLVKQASLGCSYVTSPNHHPTGALFTPNFLVSPQSQVNSVINPPTLFCSINPPVTCQYQSLISSHPATTPTRILTAATAAVPTTAYFLDESSNNVDPIECHPPFHMLHPSGNTATLLFNGGVIPTTGLHFTTTTVSAPVPPTLHCSAGMNNSNSVSMPHSIQRTQPTANNSPIDGSRLGIKPSYPPSKFYHQQQQTQKQHRRNSDSQSQAHAFV